MVGENTPQPHSQALVNLIPTQCEREKILFALIHPLLCGLGMRLVSLLLWATWEHIL